MKNMIRKVTLTAITFGIFGSAYIDAACFRGLWPQIAAVVRNNRKKLGVSAVGLAAAERYRIPNPSNAGTMGEWEENGTQSITFKDGFTPTSIECSLFQDQQVDIEITNNL